MYFRGKYWRTNGHVEILPENPTRNHPTGNGSSCGPPLIGESVVLDVGANVGVDADQLVEFAVMGSAMAQSTF